MMMMMMMMMTMMMMMLIIIIAMTMVMLDGDTDDAMKIKKKMMMLMSGPSHSHIQAVSTLKMMQDLCMHSGATPVFVSAQSLARFIELVHLRPKWTFECLGMMMLLDNSTKSQSQQRYEPYCWGTSRPRL